MPLGEENYCGFSKGSRWARGMAWAIYGYAICYSYTKDKRYLDVSERLAAFFCRHLRGDGAVVWDFRCRRKRRQPLRQAPGLDDMGYYGQEKRRPCCGYVCFCHRVVRHTGDFAPQGKCVFGKMRKADFDGTDRKLSLSGRNCKRYFEKPKRQRNHDILRGLFYDRNHDECVRRLRAHLVEKIVNEKDNR